MKAHRGNSSIISTLLLIVIAVIAWIALAPTQLGGQVSYVIVDGNSMEPNFHLGDLVLVRAQSNYQVGDIVTYWNAQLGRFVFHRIVGIDLNHFVIKGDNNTWLDTYEPSQSEIVGKLWVYIPTMGKAIEWAREPINIALMVGLLGGIVVTGMMFKPSQGNKSRGKSYGNLGGAFEGVLYIIGFLALAFLGLTIFAFTRPLTRNADNIQYQQDGYFYYSAAGTPGIYDSNKVQAGEPVFPKLTCFLNVGFAYNLTGSSLQAISGTHQLYALILDEQSGWQRTLPMDSQAAFSGNSYFSTSTLDLCQIESVVSNMEQQTGLHPSQYTLKIVNHMAVIGMVAGQSISDTFDPTLVLNFDKVHFYLNTNTTGDSPLHTSKQGMAGSTAIQANTISVLGLEPTVETIRLFAIFGLVVTLGGALIVGWFVFDALRQNEEALIRLKYGALLMDVHDWMPEPSSRIVDVASIDDLAKLAERQNTMIMHMALNFLHFYLVQFNATTYRYVVSTGKRGIVEVGPAQNPAWNDMRTIISPSRVYNIQPTRYPVLDAVNATENRHSANSDSVGEETIKRVISSDESYYVQTGLARKEMLKKIKI